MNKTLLKKKWSYITSFSFSKQIDERCISEMIYLFCIFWDRRINVINRVGSCGWWNAYFYISRGLGSGWDRWNVYFLTGSGAGVGRV